MKVILTTTITTKPVKSNLVAEYFQYKLGSIGRTRLISYDKSKDVTEHVFITECEAPKDWFI